MKNKNGFDTLVLFPILIILLAPKMASAKTYALTAKNQDTIQIELPEQWPAVKVDSNTFPTYQTQEKNKSDRIDLKITVLWGTETNQIQVTKANIQATVMKLGKELLPNSVEKSIALEKMNGPNLGYYFRVTDKSPKLGDFLLLTSGTILIKKYAVVFTLLQDSVSQVNSKVAIKALENLQLVERNETFPPGLIEESDKRFSVKPAGASFKIKINVDGLKLVDAKIKDNGRGLYFLFKKDALPNFSIWVEPPGKCDSLQNCKKIIRPEVSEWGTPSEFTRGNFSTFELVQNVKADTQIAQMRAEYFKDGYWVDVHLSYLGNSGNILVRFLNNLEIIEK